MPSDIEQAALADIRENIARAYAFVRGMRQADFVDDIKTFYAVTRCLEIVSEASRRLSDGLKSRHPYIPWKAIAGTGNIYRHEYEDVLERLIWKTVQESLPPLLAAVEAELRE